MTDKNVNSYRILVVEDNYSNYAYVRAIIPQDVIIDWADCGQKALNLYSSSVYDLIVIDIGLPDISGMDIISHIRSTDKSVPIFVTTGYVSSQNKITYLALGANEVFFKPFAWKVFRDSVFGYIEHEDNIKENPLQKI